MNIRKNRPAVAIAGLAAAAALVLTACGDDDSAGDAADNATSVVGSAITEASEAVDGGVDAVTGLSNSDAQDILRTAVNPDTPADEIPNVVDTSNPATQAAIVGYAEGSSRAGYTPDIYEVKDVEEDGDSATVSVAVDSPHAPAPIDVDLQYVKVDGDWKLSADAVEQLAGMAR